MTEAVLESLGQAFEGISDLSWWANREPSRISRLSVQEIAHKLP